MVTTMRVSVLAFALIAAVMLTAPLEADFCQLEPLCQYPPCGQQEWVCYPEYYVWQYDEPDWCLYGQYDEVVIEFSPTPTWHPVRWYVTPYSDPGRDGDYYVIHDINGSCYAWPYPF